ncbi:hypothetical protein GCM10010275_19560 [Streptomyces litmocidini]|uniref:hypothetical protein n=1 Tax=Streptomyces litmocidini TaxID=67318 RepID=UPI00167C5323|nr:hypothetical protein [Streptomyces litmocidini]GGU84589.1 hypothetical protein GCM10010275_19560 [Streptomyces litmocidini]
MIALRLTPVPIPYRVAEMVLDTMPESVCQAAIDAENALREIGRLRPLASDEDRQDHEGALAELARANKTLAAHHPAFVERGAA